MDEHSVIKMKKLAGDRMDEKAMTLQLKSDRLVVQDRLVTLKQHKTQQHYSFRCQIKLHTHV